jgi:hypothetical protein
MKRHLCIAALGLFSALRLMAGENATTSSLSDITKPATNTTAGPLEADHGKMNLNPGRLEDNRNRFLTNCTVSSRVLPPAGGLVVVAEGDYEARSLGSYSIRLYAAKSPGPDDRLFPVTIDNYKSGLIQPRSNGYVEQVLIRDLSGDGREEIIVTLRSVGRWSLISADAFRADNGQLKLAASIHDFPAGADAATLLSFKLNPAATGSKRWFDAVEAVVRVNDGKGHGPDVGSAEWQRAVSRKVFENTTDPVPEPNSKEWFAAMNKYVLTGLSQ